MTEAEFAHFYTRYEDKIEAIARKFAKDDLDLYDDLCQVGRITLWHLDPKKASSNLDAWIRKALRNKMAGHIRRQRPHRTISLDAMTEAGDQITQGPDGPVVLPFTEEQRPKAGEMYDSIDKV